MLSAHRHICFCLIFLVRSTKILSGTWLSVVRWRHRCDGASVCSRTWVTTRSVHRGELHGCNWGCLANGLGEDATSSYFRIRACFSLHGSRCSPALSSSPSWGTGDVVYSSLKVGIFDCNGNHVDFSDQKSWLSCTVHCFCLFVITLESFLWVGVVACLQFVVFQTELPCWERHTITAKLSFHFHHGPNRNLTRAPLFIGVYRPDAFNFWRVKVLLLQPSPCVQHLPGEPGG